MSEAWDWGSDDGAISVTRSPHDDTPPIEVVLPSMVFLTADQARHFAKALLRAADAVGG